MRGGGAENFNSQYFIRLREIAQLVPLKAGSSAARLCDPDARWERYLNAKTEKNIHLRSVANGEKPNGPHVCSRLNETSLWILRRALCLLSPFKAVVASLIFFETRNCVRLQENLQIIFILKELCMWIQMFSSIVMHSNCLELCSRISFVLWSNKNWNASACSSNVSKFPCWRILDFQLKIPTSQWKLQPLFEFRL